MNKIFANSLYHTCPSKYLELKNTVIKFNSIYNGSTIIQNNILQIINNYCLRNNKSVNFLKLPSSDYDLISFTCVRSSEFFIVMNSMISQNKLIFSAAHNLYHILSYIMNENNYLLLKGSLICNSTLNNLSVNSNQQYANEFAKLLLVPSKYLSEQIEIFNINKKDIVLHDCLQLMDIFAVPFNIIVERLFEESIINENKAIKLLNIDEEKRKEEQTNFNISHNWEEHDKNLINICGLEDLLINNSINSSLPENRINGDLEFVHQTFDRVNNLTK